MGHRLSKIVTRTGDAGTTGLADGSRVPKDAPRIAAIGTVDELNSAIGVLLAEPLPPEVADCLVAVQHALFDLGGELSIPGSSLVDDGHVARLQEWPVCTIGRGVPRYTLRRVAHPLPRPACARPAATRCGRRARARRRACRRAG